MARDFSGSAQDLNLGSAAALEITGDFTVSGWINPDSTATSLIFGAFENSGAFSGWGVRLGGGKLGYYSSGNGAWRDSVSSISTGVWTHFTIAITGTGAGAGTIYLNGSADATFSQAAPGTSGTTKRIAAASDGTTNYDGRAAELAVWSSGLTAPETVALAKNFSPLLIRPSALVAYWPLDGRHSPEPDRWRNALSGTLTGAPGYAEHVPVIRPYAQFGERFGVSSLTLAAGVATVVVTGHSANQYQSYLTPGVATVAVTAQSPAAQISGSLGRRMPRGLMRGLARGLA